MNSPIEDYKELAKVQNIKKVAGDVLYVNYLISDIRGDDKLVEIESTDQESLIARRNGGFPLPGMIYTFLYIPDEVDDFPKLFVTPGREKSYVDYIPMVLCFNIIDPHTFSGINLNMLPLTERLKFLNEYYEVYKPLLSDIERKTQNNVLALNDEFISMVKDGKGSKFLQLLSQKTGGNFNYAYRKYKIKKIQKFRMIEYNEWKYIPFYTPENAFLLLKTQMIHNHYWKTLK